MSGGRADVSLGSRRSIACTWRAHALRSRGRAWRRPRVLGDLGERARRRGMSRASKAVLGLSVLLTAATVAGVHLRQKQDRQVGGARPPLPGPALALRVRAGPRGSGGSRRPRRVLAKVAVPPAGRAAPCADGGFRQGRRSVRVFCGARASGAVLGLATGCWPCFLLQVSRRLGPTRVAGSARGVLGAGTGNGAPGRKEPAAVDAASGRCSAANRRPLRCLGRTWLAEESSERKESRAGRDERFEIRNQKQEM